MDQNNIIYVDYYHTFLIQIEKDRGEDVEVWEKYQEDGENYIMVTVIAVLIIR
jgi:hypothetical protein